MASEKRKRLEWFKFFPADFWHGTKEMSNEEVGAYIRLLCESWLNTISTSEVPCLPKRGTALLASLPRTTSIAWQRISKAVLSKFLTETITVKGESVEVIISKRLRREKKEALNYSKKQRDRRRGGTTDRPRSVKPRPQEEELEESKNQNKKEASGDDMAKLTQTQKALCGELATTWQEMVGSEGALCPYPRGGFSESFIVLLAHHTQSNILDAFRLWAKDVSEPERERFPIEEFMKDAQQYMLKARPPQARVETSEEKVKREAADKRQREFETEAGGVLGTPEERRKSEELQKQREAEPVVTNLRDLD